MPTFSNSCPLPFCAFSRAWPQSQEAFAPAAPAKVRETHTTAVLVKTVQILAIPSPSPAKQIQVTAIPDKNSSPRPSAFAKRALRALAFVSD
jgi:hypothetical protein